MLDGGLRARAGADRALRADRARALAAAWRRNGSGSRPRPVTCSSSGSVSSRRPWRCTCSASQPRIADVSPRPSASSWAPASASRRSHSWAAIRRAERVAGEVAERARGPVQVLHHAGGVVGDLDAEQPAHPVVERGRQVGDVERALDQRELELEAQHDVQRVGGGVGGDADQATAAPARATRAARRGRRARRRRRAPRPAPGRTRGGGRPGSPTACSGTRGSTSRCPRRGWCGPARERSGARRARGRTRAGRRAAPSGARARSAWSAGCRAGRGRC